ncbi:MAG: cation:proton antiporter [Nocardioides sp.]|nr:cation:proton antiporter [Nocardioides sp.]
MTAADTAYLVAGLALLVALVVPTLVRRVAVSAPIVLLALGVLLGLSPLTDGVSLDLQDNRAVVEHVTEFSVLVALMGVGLAIDRPLRLRERASWATWSPTWRLLAVAMPLSIGGVTLVGWAAGLPLALAVLLGAALAPTDPVLASDVQVGGPSVEGGTDDDAEDPASPEAQERSEVRFALTSEAGLNDGLAFPFVHLALLLAAGGSGASLALEWVGWQLLGRVAIALVTGYAVGALLGRLAFRSRTEATRFADRGDPLLALAALLTAYGVAELAHGYGFIAVFVCAMALRSAERHSHYHRGMHELTQRLELLLTLMGLLFLGIALGRGLLGHLPAWGAALALLLVFVIRPGAGWVSLSVAARPAPEVGGLTRAERGAVAFFGIRGVGSVYYVAYAAGHLDAEVPLSVWATVAFTIVVSVVVHGVLATPVMQRIEPAD